MSSEQLESLTLLVVPRLRVQNANAISSPMTWGFPAMTAFTGLMTALERKLGLDAGIQLISVGVICHDFDPQVSEAGYTRSFNLTRNPLQHDGSTAAIVEEGRVHLDITLIFSVELDPRLTDQARRDLAKRIDDTIAGMRIAGGSVVPPLSGRKRPTASFVQLPDDAAERHAIFTRLRRRWLPGFVLVSRADLLQRCFETLRSANPNLTMLDAWLDLSRMNFRAVRIQSEAQAAAANEEVGWERDQRQGWIVPIPVGFVGISPLHAPGTVANARDPNVPFQFVENVYSIGQWISPHRLRSPDDLLWVPEYCPQRSLYQCTKYYSGQEASSTYTSTSKETHHG